MTREEEKYQAANNAWNIRGLTNQEQKISYKLGFLEGFDYADSHPREGLWDVEKVEKVLGNLLFNKEKKIYRAYLDYDAFFEDLRKAMEE